MELKGYQSGVLDDLDGYLDALDRTEGMQAAWKAYWETILPHLRSSS